MSAAQDADREATVEDYVASVAVVVRRLLATRPDTTPESAISTAHAFVARTIAEMIDEAAGRVRVQHGLPEFAQADEAAAGDDDEDPTHAERGVEDGGRALRAHFEGADPDLEALEDLLVDLMHWAEDRAADDGEAFSDALDSAYSQWQAEREEDEANAEEIAAAPMPMADPAKREETIKRVVQMQRLRGYNPGSLDA